MTSKRKLYIIISWAAVVACMAFIFSMSAQGAEESSEMSSSFAHKLLAYFHIALPMNVLRKCAHFTEFALLGICLFNAIYATFRHRLTFVFALVCSALYAVSDEVHQLFSEGRACRFFDVCVDTSGALFGIIIGVIILKIIIERRNKNGNT